MTPSATSAREGRRTVHTRESIIRALRRYELLHGTGSATAAAFAPAAAARARRPDLIAIYNAGDRGQPWPSLNTIKSRFGGSFTAAREAAGLDANRPGPAHRRLAGRDTLRLEEAEARTVRANARIEYLERELAAARALPKKVIDKQASPAARARAVKADAAVKEARAAATREAALRERAEATIATLRAERSDLRADLARLSRRLDAASADVCVVEVPVERIVTVTKVVERPAPGEAELLAARARTDAAILRARTADGRVREAEAAYGDLAEAVNASRRRLTPVELAELRRVGPGGPAALAGALKGLARARRAGGRTALGSALTNVATAAVLWRDRL